MLCGALKNSTETLLHCEESAMLLVLSAAGCTKLGTIWPALPDHDYGFFGVKLSTLITMLALSTPACCQQKI